MTNRICGIHAVYEALASERLPIERIHISREAHSVKVQAILELARGRDIPIRKEERTVLDRIAEGGAHQGQIAQYGNLILRPGIALADQTSQSHRLAVLAQHGGLQVLDVQGGSQIAIAQIHRHRILGRYFRHHPHQDAAIRTDFGRDLKDHADLAA